MPDPLYLSPSEHHHYLMQSMTRSLAFDANNIGPWRQKLRRKLRQLLGDMPATRCDLQPRTLWTRDTELGRIEKVVFTSEPYSDVPAYVCIPHGAKPPYTFMICLQGHNTGMHNSIAVLREDETKPGPIENDRDFALSCMKHGLAALCIEQRSFGERAETKLAQRSKGFCHEATMHALMLGRTLMGERLYDVDRGIDYLAQRGDANMRRIGVMGNSGGGTLSLMAAGLLSRIAIAMPSCYFCTFADSIMSIYHCADNYVPGLLKYAEMPDILGMFAPRPVVIVAGRSDPIFPIEAVQRAFEHLKKIYAACGAADRCHLVIGEGGHQFYKDAAFPVLMSEMGRL